MLLVLIAAVAHVNVKKIERSLLAAARYMRSDSADPSGQATEYESEPSDHDADFR